MWGPTDISFTAVVATTALLAVVWHCYHYDRLRCMIPTRTEWFRALISWLITLAGAFFMIFTWLDVSIYYSAYYSTFLGKTTVTPSFMWTQEQRQMYTASMWALAMGWLCLIGVHCEEFLYWGYLLSSVVTPGGPKTSWLSSTYFKVWVICTVSCLALMLGALQIDTENLEYTKASLFLPAYVFLIGSAISIVFCVASVALAMMMPSFIRTTAKMGATFEVLDRLHFFAEMNQVRTVLRIVYSACYLVISVDVFTPKRKIYLNDFVFDLLYMSGTFGLLLSTGMSIVILFPRNMGSESMGGAGTGANNMQPMTAYQTKGVMNPDGVSPAHFLELGDRLNIDRDVMAANIEAVSHVASHVRMGAGQDDIEMAASPRPTKPARRVHLDVPVVPALHADAPFAGAADRSRRARLSEFPSLPRVMQNFTSPLETNRAAERLSGPTRVIVTTEQTVNVD